MANREEVFDQVKEILVERLDIDEDDITLEATCRDDLEADSLDLVELIMDLEERFGVKISDEEAQGINTVGEAVDFIVERHGVAPAWTSIANRNSSGSSTPRRSRSGAGVHAHGLVDDRAAVVRATGVPRRRVLGLAVAEELYRRFPDAPEGRLAPLRPTSSRGASCALVARALDLDRRASHGGGARRRGAGDRRVDRNVLAAPDEAAIGAVFLAHGWETARSAVIEAFAERIGDAEQTPSITRRSCRNGWHVRARP